MYPQFVGKIEILNMRHASTWEQYKDAPAQVVPVEHSMTPCDKCPGHCCCYIVHVSSVEVARIALTLNLEVERFVEPEPGGVVVDQQRGSRAFTPLRLDFDDERIDIAGRLRFRQVGDGISPCFFLNTNMGVGRCGIYALRPGVCRVFPYEVMIDDERRVSVGGTDHCNPNWLYDENSEREVGAAIAAWEEDLELDAQVAATWNDEERRDRSFGVFSRWLVKELAPRLGGDVERVYPTPRRRLGSKIGRRR